MAELWHYTSQGKQMEPVTLADLKGLLAAGDLKPTDMVWHEGMPAWVRASAVKELFGGPVSANSGAAPEPRRPRRRPADNDGSSIGIIVAIVFAALVLLGSLLVGVIILWVRMGDGGDDRTLKRDDDKKGEVARPIDGETKYDAVIRFGGDPHVRTFKFKAAHVYELVVKRFGIDADANIDLAIKNANDTPLAKPNLEVDAKITWTPKEDGEYRVELQTNAARDVRASVSIKNLGPEPKEEPLPKGVYGGKDQITTGDLAPGKVVHYRFRVKAGHAASFNATCIGVKPGSDINLYVTRDEDNSKDVFASDTKPDPHAGVNFTRPQTEIVRLRIENASKSVTNKCSILYNVSP